MNYQEFLNSKQRKIIEAGFDIEESKLNSNLFDFQRYIVKKALKMGRYAIFADCGLGKTLMQLEFAHKVSHHTQKPVLILCPLAVAGQTIKEGEKLGRKGIGIELKDKYFETAVRNVNKVLEGQKQLALF